MTDNYINENKATNSTINHDLRLSASQNDGKTMNQTARSQENMEEDRNSTNTSQNVLDDEKVKVENSGSINPNPTGMVNSRENTVYSSDTLPRHVVDCTETAKGDILPSTCVMVDQNKATMEDTIGTLTHHGDCKLVDRSKETVEDTVDNINHQGDQKLVDKNKATAEDAKRVLNDHVGNGNTVEDHQPGMVNRRQSTFDSTGNLMEYVMDCKEKKIEDNVRSKGIVYRNKARVEDPVVTLTHMDDSKLVDRSKATVEDTVTLCSHHIVDGLVDRSKATVEDPVGILTQMGDSKLVDRSKATVEDTVTTSSHHIVDGLVDRNKATVEDPVGTLTHDGDSSKLVGRNKATVKDTVGKLSSSHVSDRDKFKDDDLIGFYRNNINHGNPEAPDTRVLDDNQGVVGYSAGESTWHVVDVESRSEMAVGAEMVDRNKETVEDSATSNQATCVNNPDPANSMQHTSVQSKHHIGATSKAIPKDSELEHQLQAQCNIVDRRQEGEKWTIQLQVHIDSVPSIINFLPSSRTCFQWNKPVLFGRRPGVHVFINDDHASRDHVELIGQILPNGQVSFMTRNMSKRVNTYSVNGNYINDNNRSTPLSTGDQITIAGLVFTVVIIPARVSMQDFILEIISPQIQCNPTTSPMPPSLIGHPHQRYNNPYIYTCAGPSPAYMVPVYLPPSTSMHMSPPWLSQLGVVPPGQSYLTSEMVEDAFRQYRDREGYVKFSKLRYLAAEALDHFKQLGRALGLEEWQLIRIDRDNPDTYEKSYQMLLTWVWKNPQQATIDNLRKGLEDITVGRGDLAVKYCTTTENHEDVNVSGGGNDTGREGET